MQGRILSHYGRQAWVMDAHGKTYSCVFKGRDQQPTVNDHVEINTEVNPAVITALLPRHNVLMRSEAHRAKTLGANIDQILVVVSGTPIFSDEILARIICAAVASGLTGIIALNKSDLIDATAQARAQLADFAPALRLLGWPIIETCTIAGASTGLQTLADQLSHRTTLVLGQSGMGKSSLLNALIPGLNAKTREISEALQTGKHTTTTSQMVAVEPGPISAPDEVSWVIDTPGFQLFGVHHLSISEMALGFPEFAEVQSANGRCRYANCRHTDEPGCSIQAAVREGRLPTRRLELWQLISQS